MSEKIKPVPHKHAAVIKAWADGARVEFRHWNHQDWVTVEKGQSPAWQDSMQYRIKPEPSDLERYGVCVGDLWLLEEGNVFFNYLVTRITSFSPYHTEGILVGTGARKELRLDYLEATLTLRRGEVNKL